MPLSPPPPASEPDLSPTVPAALFLIALALEAGQRVEVISAELEQLAAAYFARCPPPAKA